MNEMKWELIERQLGLIKKEYFDPYSCRDCKVTIVINDGHFICPKCGLVHQQELISYWNNHVIKYRVPYKRQSYYTEKLRLLMRQKKCKDKNYITLLSSIKKKSFNTIHNLKKIMQSLKLGRYYKFIIIFFMK